MQNLYFCSKIDIMDKNRNYGQKSKLWSKIEIIVKNRNYGQKSKFKNRNSKIEILLKKEIMGTNPNFAHRWKFWSNWKKMYFQNTFSEKNITERRKITITL